MSTRILFTGQTFLAGKDVAPALQQQVEQLMQGLSDQNGNGVPDVLEGSGNGSGPIAKSQQFIVNGRRYSSIDEMPSAERKLFDQMRGIFIDQAFGGSQSEASAAPSLPAQGVAGDPPISQPGDVSSVPTILNPSPESSDLGWLVQFFVLLLGILIGLAIAVTAWFALK
jgi:hypothetical protein